MVAASRVRAAPSPLRRQPAEWTPHEACWVAWPSHADLWLENLAPARAAFVALCAAIAAGPASDARGSSEVLVPDAEAEAAARARCRATSRRASTASPSATSGCATPRRSSSRTRAATSPAAALRLQRLGRQVRARPRRRGRRARRRDRRRCRRCAFACVLEGGSVDVDGEGTVPHDAPVPAQPEPQPRARRRPSIERGARATRSAVETVLWLGDGLLNDHTDGHVDTIARFVAPGVVRRAWSRAERTTRTAPSSTRSRATSRAMRDARGPQARGRAHPVARARRSTTDGQRHAGELRQLLHRQPRRRRARPTARRGTTRPSRAHRRALPRAAHGRRRRARHPRRRRRVPLHHAAAARGRQARR